MKNILSTFALVLLPLQSINQLPSGTRVLGFQEEPIPEAPDPFAREVVEYIQGTGAGLFDTQNILAGPRGGGMGSGSFHVLSLGAGGSVTLGFEAVMTDGPGADFTVFENGFATVGGVFAEVVFVEVSSDGTNFARFPSTYDGPVSPSAFGSIPYASYSGLAGGLPVLANVLTNSIDPLDPVVSGGEAFDLAELYADPLVTGGQLDLSAVRFVRLLDIESGLATDSQMTTIYDNGAPGSADIDAVAVVQHTTNQSPNSPTVDFYLDGSGFLHLILHDPNGLGDLDSSTLHASENLVTTTYDAIKATYFVIQSSDAYTEHLVTPVPVPGSGMRVILSVSVRDHAGHFSGDQIALQG